MNCYNESTYNPEVITFMSYDEWDRINNNIKRSHMAKKIKERKRMTEYYKRQRFFGALIMFIGIICIIFGCVISQKILQYFGTVVGMTGLYIIITKKMILVDNYYLERQDKMSEF